MPTFTSMNDKGSPDMNPEQWANAVYTPLKKAVMKERLIINLAPITGLGEGWWVNPAYFKKTSRAKRNDSC